ncbi:hypothetical protein PR048_031730 [Dryococelus australis]|uniref:Uncharacterized protein n=1 Tax=Dryococelus australis TaxID=614101 RepID=A0ABQ9G647_9NEOP|nr:hypothetical protein PR048_031730 [Dryococelus australis]
MDNYTKETTHRIRAPSMYYCYAEDHHITTRPPMARHRSGVREALGSNLGQTGFNPRPGHRIFASGICAGQCRWLAGFLGDLLFPPPLHSGAAQYSLQSPPSALKTSLAGRHERSKVSTRRTRNGSQVPQSSASHLAARASVSRLCRQTLRDTRQSLPFVNITRPDHKVKKNVEPQNGLRRASNFNAKYRPNDIKPEANHTTRKTLPSKPHVWLGWKCFSGSDVSTSDVLNSAVEHITRADSEPRDIFPTITLRVLFSRGLQHGKLSESHDCEKTDKSNSIVAKIAKSPQAHLLAVEYLSSLRSRRRCTQLPGLAEHCSKRNNSVLGSSDVLFETRSSTDDWSFPSRIYEPRPKNVDIPVEIIPRSGQHGAWLPLENVGVFTSWFVNLVILAAGYRTSTPAYVPAWLEYSPPTLANPVRFPAGAASGLSHVGIVSDDVVGRRVFSGISRFPSPCIPALLHIRLASPSSALKISMLRVAQISPLQSYRLFTCAGSSEHWHSVERFFRCSYPLSRFQSTAASLISLLTHPSARPEQQREQRFRIGEYTVVKYRGGSITGACQFSNWLRVVRECGMVSQWLLLRAKDSVLFGLPPVE